ncbi:DUF805 domain-containing protein [Dickeya fangzhongdai]|uniref:DUF805 domain-containing protein n=1 Tax=Dickeya fangzhongdai TaxID=1778540 RepID=UPI0026E06DF8|nr:DUF805 domain-containing protein [Dickeya fangzhongdai]WKV51811.1 molecular chaperone DnaJ [Dickeya fangzhongdai]
MDNLCWQLLGIEPTQDMDAIRQAYRQTLPQFHPETDPEGFKRLRQAYDAACRLAQHTGEPEEHEQAPAEADAPADDRFEFDAETEPLRAAFEQLLSDPAARVQPIGWERFIHTMDQFGMTVVEQARWPLLKRLYREPCLSASCAGLLAERLRWRQRLDELPQELAGEMDEYLDFLARGDWFDFSSLAGLNLPAQLETIFFLQQCRELFWNRPGFMLKTLLSDSAVIVWPDCPALMHQLARWYSLAELPQPLLRDYCLEQLAAHPQDSEWLRLSAHHCALAGDEQQAFELWRRLYLLNRHGQAEQWLIDWCARRQPEWLPLLIQSFNSAVAPSLDGVSLEDSLHRFFQPEQTVQMMARWGDAAQLPLSSRAADYVQWKLGAWKPQIMYAHLVRNHCDTLQDQCYWHACMLTFGNERLLRDMLDQPIPEEPLPALVMSGLRAQAEQRLQWLATSSVIQAFTAWLAAPSDATLPAEFDDTDSVVWNQVYSWLMQWRRLPPGQLRKLTEHAECNRMLEPVKDWLAFLASVWDIVLPEQERVSARDEFRHAMLLTLMVAYPRENLSWLRRLEVPSLPESHPAYALYRLYRQLDAVEPDDAMRQLSTWLVLSDGLHYNCWMRLPVSVEGYLRQDGHSYIAAASQFYSSESGWRETVAQAPLIYQILFHAIYCYLGSDRQSEKHREWLQQLEGTTPELEQIANAVLERQSDELYQALKPLDDDKRIGLIGRMIDKFHQNEAYLPDNDEQALLDDCLRHAHDDVTLRLVAKILQQYADERESHFKHNGATRGRFWQFWRMSDRIDRAGFFAQNWIGALLLYTGGNMLLEHSPHKNLVIIALLLLNLFSAARRRFNDMGSSSPSLSAFCVVLLPIFVFLPLCLNGSKRWNRFGPPKITSE